LNSICIIIPVYNESLRLQVSHFTKALEQSEDLFFIFVDDGSKDVSVDILKEIRKTFPYRVRIAKHNQNKGKAEAIRKGALLANKWQNFFALGYWDADLSTPLSEIIQFEAALRESGSLCMVMGYRKFITYNKSYYLTWRFFASTIFKLLIRIIFRLPYDDTQCGAKLIRSNVIHLLFSEPFISTWLIDIEILLRLRRIQKPVPAKELFLEEWTHHKGSHLHIQQSFKILKELIQVYKFYRG